MYTSLPLIIKTPYCFGFFANKRRGFIVDNDQPFIGNKMNTTYRLYVVHIV